MSPALWRDDKWLQNRLEHLWNLYYSDAPRGYPISITFGRHAKYRYGSIFNRGRQCRILINGMFAHGDLPEYVVDATICHELAHYVHGYASGLPKLHANPHRGGVIDKEMAKRGCYHLEELAMEWRNGHWKRFLAEHSPQTAAREQRALERAAAHWTEYLGSPDRRSIEQIESRLAELALFFHCTQPPFRIEWLLSSTRRRGLSYRFRGEDLVRIHPLLADCRVPSEVLDYELCYWMAQFIHGGSWNRIEGAIREAGLWNRAQKAIRWRRRVWPTHVLDCASAKLEN